MDGRLVKLFIREPFLLLTRYLETHVDSCRLSVELSTTVRWVRRGDASEQPIESATVATRSAVRDRGAYSRGTETGHFEGSGTEVGRA